MDQHHFKPVVARTCRSQYRDIASVEEAADFLVHNWPANKGMLRVQTQMTCSECMEDVRSIDYARAAFVSALKKADIYVREER